MNLGISAAYKLWAAHDLSDIEAYILEAPFEFTGWERDLRGGVFLLTIRQSARALRGKTHTGDALTLLDDEEFSTAHYVDYIETTASNPERPLSVFWSYYCNLLYRFGYIAAAIVLGEKLVEMSKGLFSMRCVRFQYAA